MNIQITHRTKTKDILPLLNAENIERLLDAVPEHPLKTAIFSIEIRTFADILTDEQSFIESLLSERKALVAFGMLKEYRKEIQQFTAFLKQFDFKETSEEQQAKRGIQFPDMAMRMLTDVTRFFGLKSFDDAERMKVSDWLAVFQNDAASALYQRKLNDIYRRKSEVKKKGGRR